ncbi:putative ribonuclease H-like domain-containing protein [Tanacetum coccineum]
MYGSLCDLPDGKRVIGTKWVFRNKRDEQGTIIKNKARLVAQGWMSKVHFICNITEEVPKSMFYVDDIIFGSTKSSMVKDFEDLMQKEFKMSSMGELTFFLRLQVKQTTTGKDEEGEEVDVHLYRGQSDRLSTSGGCQYLEEDCPLGQCKKQTIVAISSIEAEYVAAASCYAQTAHNADFYQIIDYLTGCSINYSLGKPFSADLLFDDADGVDCFPKQVIWDSLRDIGYEGNLAQLTFSKPLFSPQWKYLVHVLLHCLSPKSTSWEQFGTNIASALVGLATNQKFNFSLMIMNGMLGHIANGKPFLMYPRFIQLFLNKQLEGVTRPQNFIPSVTLPSKDPPRQSPPDRPRPPKAHPRRALPHNLKMVLGLVHLWEMRCAQMARSQYQTMACSVGIVVVIHLQVNKFLGFSSGLVALPYFLDQPWDSIDAYGLSLKVVIVPQPYRNLVPRFSRMMECKSSEIHSYEGMVSSIPIVGSISPKGFLPPILLLVVMVVIVAVILVVVVVAIIGVVIVVVIIGVVVVVGGVSFIIKLSFMII